MDIQKEREAFESWWEGFHNGRQIACDYIEEDNSYSVGYANAQWVAWQAKAQAVHEQVLDAPACVGGGTFQKGVKWSTVIAAAQRHFKYTQNAKKAPSLDIDQVKKLVSGDFVLVPKERLAKAVDGIEALFKEDSTLALGELLPIQQDLNAMIEAQEQK